MIPEAPRAVVVLGCVPRSGTNYLADVLCCHPRVVIAAGAPEDHFLRDAPRLIAYAESTRAHWLALWPDWPELRVASINDLTGALGHALLEMGATSGSPEVVVHKTPEVGGLHLTPRLWPNVPVFVLVRDGRAVVESMRRSWGTKLDVAAARWQRSIATIQETFGDPAGRPDDRLLVYYEDLTTDPVGSLDTLLDHARLDSQAVDTELVKTLPVRGSSTEQPESGLGWSPLERPAGFDPLRRWAETWSAADHRTFWAIAGEGMDWLGYGRGERVSPATADRVRISGLAARRSLGRLAPRPLLEWYRRNRLVLSAGR